MVTGSRSSPRSQYNSSSGSSLSSIAHLPTLAAWLILRLLHLACPGTLLAHLCPVFPVAACSAKAMLGYISLLLWVGILSVAVGMYDITLVKVGAGSPGAPRCSLAQQYLSPS